MKPWKLLNENNIKDIRGNSFQILKCINDLKDDFFSNNRGERTRLIKTELTKLGHELKNKVYANGLNKNVEEIENHLKNINQNANETFINKEWLFDLQWYTEPSNTAYCTESFSLVMECEWELTRKEDRKNDYSAMKFDFQKLLISNADLRLMIFKLRKKKDINEDLKELTEYFNNAINGFNNLVPNSQILIIASREYKSEEIKKFVFLECCKGGKQSLTTRK